MEQQSYKTCKNGHLLTPDNVWGKVKQTCKACGLAAQKRFLDARPGYEKERSIRRNNSERLCEDRIQNPDKYRDYEFQRTHGITLEQYNQQGEQQNWKCFICNTSEAGGKYNKFMVDHDHRCCPQKRGTCGKCNRGLLCYNCNITLGYIENNTNIVSKILQYIELWNQKHYEQKFGELKNGIKV
jgi:hypothetical protein